MASVNRVTLIGRIGQEPELKQTASGKAVCNLSIATDDGFGENKTTSWHRVTVWDKAAEAVAKYMTKGKEIYIEGRIQYREFTDKEGNKRTSTEIQAHTVQFLGGKEKSSGGDWGSGGSD